MAAPTAAELKARAEELDRREASIAAREEQASTIDTELTDRIELIEQRDAELATREAELTQREASIHRSETALEGVGPEPGAVTFSTLPDPRDGYGYVIVEAELPLVAVFAGLHPSDRASVASQAAGAMRMSLMESGRLRKLPRVEPGVDMPELAILSGSA